MSNVNVTEFIDQCRFSRLQLIIAIWCGVLTALDGLDVQVIAFVAPIIAPEWHVAISDFGPIFGLGLLGFLLGSLIAGPLADSYGRKPVIVIASVAIGVFSLLTAGAHSMTELLALRVLTGLGLGGVLPNAVALTSEYAPRRRRTLVIAVMFCGYSIGGAISALVSSLLIPVYGWPSAFLFGGTIPILLAPAIFWWVPESINFMVQHGQRPKLVASLLNRIGGAARFRGDESFFLAETRLKGFTVKQLFTERRAATTTLLWAAFFCNLLVLYLLAAWLPAMMRESGLPIATAIRFTAFLNLGGIVGSCAFGPLCDRLGSAPVIAALHVLAAVSVVIIALAGPDETVARGRHYRRRLRRHRRPQLPQRAGGQQISDRDPLDRPGLGTGHRPCRLDHRSVDGGGVARQPSRYPFALFHRGRAGAPRQPRGSAARPPRRAGSRRKARRHGMNHPRDGLG